MKELKEFVDRENKWSAIFGSPALSLQSAADRKKIANKIDSCLSPENLTCDGELSPSQVQARYRTLMRVAQELRSIDPRVEFYEAHV